MGILDNWLGLNPVGQIIDHVQEMQQKKYKSILVNADESLEFLRQIRLQKDEVLQQKAMLEQLSVQTEGCWKGASGDALRTVLANAIAEHAAIAKDLENDTLIMTQAIQSLIDTDEKIAELIHSTGSGSGGGRRG